MFLLAFTGPWPVQTWEPPELVETAGLSVSQGFAEFGQVAWDTPKTVQACRCETANNAQFPEASVNLVRSDL